MIPVAFGNIDGLKRPPVTVLVWVQHPGQLGRTVNETQNFISTDTSPTAAGYLSQFGGDSIYDSVGVCFFNLGIPKNADIVEAHRIGPTSGNVNGTGITIKGAHLPSGEGIFTSANIYDRLVTGPKTTASVPFVVAARNYPNFDYQEQDVTSVIQELVQLSDWTTDSGAILITKNSDTGSVYTYGRYNGYNMGLRVTYR